MSRSVRLSWSVLLAYSAAQFGLSASNTLVSTQLPFFYVDTLLLPPALFGVVMLVAKLMNAVTDPLVGHLTDSTRHRWGRRRPWLLFGAPVLALTTYLLFSPPERTGDALFGWLLVSFVATLTFRTAVETPYQAIAPELTPDYDERTRLSTWRTSIGMAGDFGGAIVPMVLLAVWAARPSFRAAGAVVALSIVVGVGIAFLGVREKQDWAGVARPALRENLRRILLFPLRNRPAALLFTCFAASIFATTMPVSVFRFLNRYLFTATGLEGTPLAPWIESIGTAAFLDIATILAYFAGIFVSAPFWARALRARDKKHGYIFAFAYMAVVALGIFAIPRQLGILFPVLNLFIGGGALGLWMIPGALAPDILEWEELHHGGRHEGGFFGIWMLTQKVGNAFALFAVGILLGSIGFVPDREQGEATLLGLRFLFGGASVIVASASALLFTRYPITREVYADLQARLAERRGERAD